MKDRLAAVLLLFVVTAMPAAAQDGADRIRLNQIGFYPDAPKQAVVVGAEAGPFQVVREESGETVYEGTLGEAREWALSGETVRRADFSGLSEPGSYQITVPGVGASYAFEVDGLAHQSVAEASLKAYYYMRASTALPEEYAGRWARAAGHPDTQVQIHPSAATEERPAGATISAPKGWYDAGDYNKYVVNSGISTYTLLALLEHYPDYAVELSVNIPEGDNDVPDVLDEAMWNLRWMMDMQDPNDGGVYHKLTSPNFSGFVTPQADDDARYVVQKGTAATLDFAAVMAHASRLVADYPEAFPGLADSMRTAAVDAWAWAQENPNVAYDQDAINSEYDPDITTGAYADGYFGDEEAWAAAELFVTTGDASYLDAASPLNQNLQVPGWPNVAALGWYTLLHHREQAASVLDTTSMKNRFLQFADDLANTQNPYGVLMGSGDFFWGSNGHAGNQAMVLMRAFEIEPDSTYLWGALSNLDYLLGRNATGYSFLTGTGDRTPMHPHHRPSASDDVTAPVPGLLVGGPNPGQEDGCDYPSDLPATSYLDSQPCYATNEITINWNAPLLYTAGALEAVLGDASMTTVQDPVNTGDASAPRLLPLYPNPARNRAQVAFRLDRPEQVRLRVSNVLGRRVAMLRRGEATSGVHRLAWNTSGLAPGLYIVRLITDRATQTQTVVKVN